jgi:hypothetical protein
MSTPQPWPGPEAESTIDVAVQRNDPQIRGRGLGGGRKREEKKEEEKKTLTQPSPAGGITAKPIVIPAKAGIHNLRTARVSCFREYGSPPSRG